MFYKMMENKCREWYSSEQCTVRDLIEYIEKTGQMRDGRHDSFVGAHDSINELALVPESF